MAVVAGWYPSPWVRDQLATPARDRAYYIWVASRLLARRPEPAGKPRGKFGCQLASRPGGTICCGRPRAGQRLGAAKRGRQEPASPTGNRMAQSGNREDGGD